MNDLPFSEGKTTSSTPTKKSRTRERGRDGKPEEPKDEPVMAAESGEDAETAEESAGSEKETAASRSRRRAQSRKRGALFGDARA
jgi:hypothetical protein